MSSGHKRAKTFEDIFNDDDTGLLDDVAPIKKHTSFEDKLKVVAIDLFEFIQTNRRLPLKDSPVIKEGLLFVQLSDFQKSDPQLFLEFQNYAQSLKEEQADLNQQSPDSTRDKERTYSNLDDIFADDDDLGLLDGAEVTLPARRSRTGQPSNKIINKADYVAKARPCKDFARYETFFAEVSAQLKAGNLKVVKYSGYDTKALDYGQIFMLSGMMVLLVDLDKENLIRASHKSNYRLRLIYSNQIEVDPFNYTFMQSLNEDDRGSQIVPLNEAGREFMEDLKRRIMKIKESNAASGKTWRSNATQEASEEENTNGYIYVLKSLSTHPSLMQFMQDSALVKIGFCTTSVKERIKNARHEATYLYADVEVIYTCRCTNIDPHQFEYLVHAILAEHRLNVTLQDQNGNMHQPREWFTVSPETAKEVVQRILDKSIVNYRVNKLTGKLVKIKQEAE